MMKFYKYQGAGNDFIMVDQRTQQWLTRADTTKIEKLCDRRFGIGADGLILLQSLPGYDFEMVYFNSDGRESTMCGNGGRCIAAFAHDLGMDGNHFKFMAIDGAHEAAVDMHGTRSEAWVELKMSDVKGVEVYGDAYVLNTGSPHFVRFVTEIDQLDMVAEGRAVRYNHRFAGEGINVNMVAPFLTSSKEPALKIRTYERGVENETLACGTGVTAAAIASYFEQSLKWGKHEIAVEARGGNLSVRFQAHPDNSFTDVWLSGPAAFVFEGQV
ncbi:MAG: diaminopimelate epimerase [Saprospiraceae bacterium]|nr:diaminopimelate epimerase [Saprospiraceae bacterium]